MKLGVYRHYKGNHYRVLFVAKHSETLEEMVVYEAMYENKDGTHWVRPRSMFEEEVQTDKGKVKRFRCIEGEYE